MDFISATFWMNPYFSICSWISKFLRIIRYVQIYLDQNNMYKYMQKHTLNYSNTPNIFTLVTLHNVVSDTILSPFIWEHTLPGRQREPVGKYYHPKILKHNYKYSSGYTLLEMLKMILINFYSPSPFHVGSHL